MNAFEKWLVDNDFLNVREEIEMLSLKAVVKLHQIHLAETEQRDAVPTKAISRDPFIAELFPK